MRINPAVKGDYLSLDLLGGNSELGRSEDGCIDLDLAPYCSRLYIFDENDNVLQQLAKEKGIPKAAGKAVLTPYSVQNVGARCANKANLQAAAHCTTVPFSCQPPPVRPFSKESS